MAPDICMCMYLPLLLLLLVHVTQVPVGLTKLVAALSIVDEQFARRRKLRWETMESTDSDNSRAPYTEEAVRKDKAWCDAQPDKSRGDAEIDESSVDRDEVLEEEAFEATKQFALCTKGYCALCMTCSTCHALCILNVDRVDGDRFGFFVNTGMSLVDKTRKWVDELTYEQLHTAASRGKVKQCCQENENGDWDESKVFMMMKNPVLPRDPACK